MSLRVIRYTKKARKKIVCSFSRRWGGLNLEQLLHFHELFTSNYIRLPSKPRKTQKFLHNELAKLCRRSIVEHQNGDTRGHLWSWRKYLGQIRRFCSKFYFIFVYFAIIFKYFFGKNRPAGFSLPPVSLELFSVVVVGFVFKSRSQRPRATPTLAVGGWVTLQPFYFDIFFCVCLIVKFSEIPPRGFQKWIKKLKWWRRRQNFILPFYKLLTF